MRRRRRKGGLCTCAGQLFPQLVPGMGGTEEEKCRVEKEEKEEVEEEEVVEKGEEEEEHFITAMSLTWT